MAISALGNLSVNLELDSSRFSRGIEQAQKRVQKFGRTMQRVGSSMTRNITLPMTIAAGGTVKAFSNFDDAMTKSLAIMGDLSDAMRKDMSNAARATAKTVTFSARESADAFFFLASAGLDAKSSMEALPVVAKFAQAGAFDLARATDLLTDAQSALGLTIKNDAVANMENMVKVSDVLVKANTLANASVDQFSTALTSKAGAALKTFNIDIEEGVAVLAAFADQGVKAELAGNALDRILRLLPKAVAANKEEFEKFGVSVFDAQGNINNLGDIIGDLEDALEGMSDEQKFATLQVLGFDARVQAVIKPLLGTSDAIRQYEAELRKAGGTTDDVSSKQLEGFGNKMKLIRNRIVDVSITVGEILAPAVISVAEKVADAAEAFANLSPAVQKSAVVLAGVVAATGPLVFVFGKLATSLLLFTGPAGLIALTIIGFGTLGATLREKTNPAITAAKEAEEELQRVLNDTSASTKSIESAKDNAREKLNLARSALAAAKAELELSAVQQDALGMDAFIGGTATQRRIAELEGAINKLNKSINDSVPVIERHANEFMGLGGAAGEATDGIDDLNETIEGLGETVKENTVDFSKLNLSIMSVEQSGREAAISIRGIDAEQVNAVRSAKQMEENMREFNAALADTERQLQDQQRIWQNLVDGVQNAWVGFFEDVFQGRGLKSVKDFLNTVKDLFFRVIAEIAAKWAAAKIFGGTFSIGGISLGSGGGTSAINVAAIGKKVAGLFGGGGTGGITGVSVTGGAAGAGLGGAAAAGGGITGASVTGGAAGAGLGGGAAAGGTTAAWVQGAGWVAVPFIASAAFNAMRRPSPASKALPLLEAGLGARGPLGLSTAEGGGVGFAGGANLDFARAFAESQGLHAAPGIRDEFLALQRFQKDRGRIIGTEALGMDEMLKVLKEAEQKFEQLKTLGKQVFKDIGISAKDMGDILRDGVVTELEQSRLGIVSLGEISAIQFGEIALAIDEDRLRLEALRGEIGFNQAEMELFGDIGIDTAQLIADGFLTAEGIVSQSLQSLVANGVTGFRELEGAARSAAAAAASIGGGSVPSGGTSGRGEGGGGSGSTQESVQNIEREIKRISRNNLLGPGFRSNK